MERQLVEPDVVYEASYRAYVAEIEAAGERAVPFSLGFPIDDMAEHVRRLHALAQRAPGFVPNSTFWLVEGNEVLAVSNLRRRLNRRLRQHGGHIGYGVRPSARGGGNGKLLLALTLDRARQRGIPRLLITCAKDNLASVGVAEANGGVLTKEHWREASGDGQPGYLEQHYWIDLAEPRPST